VVWNIGKVYVCADDGLEDKGKRKCHSSRKWAGKWWLL